jgi:5'-nucleotidase
MHEACISVTPLHLDMTHRATLAALKAALAGLAEA